MAQVPCQAMQHLLETEDCSENFAGVGRTIYAFRKADLAAPMVADGCTYTAPTFKAGKGLYKIFCRKEVNIVDGKSIKAGKGYEKALKFGLDKVNKKVSEVCRSLNNDSWGFIVPDGDDIQIVYHPDHKVEPDDGGITTSTGASAEDDRVADFAFTLTPIRSPNY